ncbi:MAG: DUF4407 domain-containing protein [Flammeovirgaceae bacterium]|nr:DUF4407 domain-containing protein [Flammeovirgaceae bacterium]
MQRLIQFFLHCSGADLSILEKCPSEKSKYSGIGTTIFFTGLFAALAAAYALYTVFDSIWIGSLIGILWGLMIFNLDRYIVSSMRKNGNPYKEILTALPRLLLAIMISIVIAKPLELKIFEKEIEPELIVMEQQAFAMQEEGIRSRYKPALTQLDSKIAGLKNEIQSQAIKRDKLAILAQQEADGTGGSKKKNLGPIYKIKKADAEQAQHELQSLTNINNQKIIEHEMTITLQGSLLNSELQLLTHKKMNGPAARLEALNRLTQQSDAIWLANLFIILLFIMVETAPIFVKLISSKGPYDNLLKVEEHKSACSEIEEMAVIVSKVREQTAKLAGQDQEFVSKRLEKLVNP